jgi:hypothetical protein
MKFELNEQVIIDGSQHPSKNCRSDFFGTVISLTNEFNIKYHGPIYGYELKIDKKYIRKINIIDIRFIPRNQYFKLNKGTKIIQNGIEYILQNDIVLQSKDNLIIDKV